MADPFAAQEEPAAPAAPPAPALTPEIEAFIAQRVQSLADTRISGLQSLYDKKLAEQTRAHQSEIARLRRQVLPEEDDGMAEDSESARELAELKRQLAIRDASEKFPKAGPLYRQLMGFETAEEQIAFLEEQLAAATPAPAPAAPPTPVPQPDADLEVPDVDMNRPAPGVGGYSGFDGEKMTDEMAARILSTFQEWPRAR